MEYLWNIHGWHILLVDDVALVIVEFTFDVKSSAIGLNIIVVGIAMGIHNRGIVNRNSSGMANSRGVIAMNLLSLEYHGNIRGWHMLLVKDITLP